MSLSTETKAPMSWDDLRALPEDGRRFELWEGELYELAPGPSHRHQSAAAELFVPLYLWAKGHPGARVFFAPLDVAFRAEAPARVVQPDLLVMLPGGQAKLHQHGILGAPDVVVEILSPSSVRHDLVRKGHRYAQEGVRSYWIVRPHERSIEVWPLEAPGRWGQARVFVEDMVLTDPVLEGFELPLAEVFGGEEDGPTAAP